MLLAREFLASAVDNNAIEVCVLQIVVGIWSAMAAFFGDHQLKK